MNPSGPEASLSHAQHARRLAKERKWAELASLEGVISHDELDACPELAYLIADGNLRIGRIDAAVALAERAESGARRAGDRRLTLRALNLLGVLAFERGRTHEADARFHALLELATDWDDDEFAARAANNLGILANVRGEREMALTSYQRALAAYHRLGHARGLAQTHYNLGISYRDLQFNADADRHFSTAIRIAEQNGHEDVIALAETERGLLRAREGDGQLAETIGTRALARLRAMQDPAGTANALRMLAEAAWVRREIDLSGARLEQALGITTEHPDLLLRSEILRDLGRLRQARGEVAAARAAVTEAIQGFESVGAFVEAEKTRVLSEST